MKAVSVRSYRLLVWVLPVFLVVAARGLFLRQAEIAYENVAAAVSTSARISSTGIYVRELPEMKNDLELLANKKMAIASSLLGARSEAVLYDLLMLKARETGVSIVSIAPRPARAAAGFTELPLTLEAAGSYDNLAQFTNAIETVGRLMRVEELVMGKDRTGALTATIRLLAYRYEDSLLAGAPKKGKQETVFEKREQYLTDLKSALSVALTPPVGAYTVSGRGDPFGAERIVAGNRSAKADSAAAKKSSIGLTLKGILWKEPPLAILETLDGRTFIVKPGDSVAGTVVSSITRNEITVVTPQGSHVLHQYDQK
jgi:type IV pilus assembly protein PilO